MLKMVQQKPFHYSYRNVVLVAVVTHVTSTKINGVIGSHVILLQVGRGGGGGGEKNMEDRWRDPPATLLAQGPTMVNHINDRGVNGDGAALRPARPE